MTDLDIVTEEPTMLDLGDVTEETEFGPGFIPDGIPGFNIG